MRAPQSVFSQSVITGYARLCSVFNNLNSNFVPKVISHSNSSLSSSILLQFNRSYELF